MKQAVWTWEQIRQGTVTGIKFSEETITDVNLQELQRSHPQEIRTRKCSRHVESINGADWEWWLHSHDWWLGLRVQAKKIDPQRLIYRNLDKKSRTNRQIELLTDKALRNQPPMIPVYVLYNYWDVRKHDPPWHCGTYAKMIEMLGCSICHAMSLKHIMDQGFMDLEMISGQMYPWSCLVCCHGFSEADNGLPKRALDFLRGAFKEHMKEEEAELLARTEFVVTEAPYYVYRILEGEELEEQEWEKIGVSRISLISEKKERSVYATED